MKATPRPYQSDMLAAIAKGFETFKKQLVVSPTGSGKTNVFCWLTQTELANGGRILILVDQEELVWQPFQRLKDIAGVTSEIEKAEWKADIKAHVVIASVQTMCRRLDKWPQDSFSLMIADEADKSLAKTWQSCLKHFDGTAKVCGFTATPWRGDKRNLGEYYENIPYEISLVELIRQKYLSPIVIKQIPVKIDISQVTSFGGDYDVNQLNDAITPHLKTIGEAIGHHANFRRTLIFVPLIATSQKFVSILKELGLHAEHIDGESEDRKEKIARFAKGEFDILVNSMLLTRGVDIPAVDCLVCLRPTKSISLYQQIIGRGTRLSPGKEDLLILDFFFEAGKKMVCRPAHLVSKDEEEAESIIEIQEARAFNPEGEKAEELTQSDLLNMQSEAQAKRERKLREQIEAHKDKKAKTISAAEFAASHGAMKIVEYQPTMPWESKPINASQKKHLEKAGIDISTVNGFQHATELINVYYKTKPVEMASEKQRRYLRQRGYSNWATATKREAAQFFAMKHAQSKEVVFE